jgi:hypothetical protein
LGGGCFYGQTAPRFCAVRLYLFTGGGYFFASFPAEIETPRREAAGEKGKARHNKK